MKHVLDDLKDKRNHLFWLVNNPEKVLEHLKAEYNIISWETLNNERSTLQKRLLEYDNVIASVETKSVKNQTRNG